MSDRRPMIFRKARASVLWALLLFLPATEVALGVLGVDAPNFTAPDELLGRVLRPYAEGWYTQEGRSYVRMNSHGMRDVEHAVAKPPGTYRIAILGDSYAEARELDIEKSYWGQLGGLLESCPDLAGRKIEVLNFGAVGYGTAQEYLQYRERVWKFAPDLVVLSFTTSTDLRNNSKKLETDQMRPFFVFEGGRLVLDDSFARHPSFRRGHSLAARVYHGALDRSRLLRLAVRSLQSKGDEPQEPGASARYRPLLDEDEFAPELYGAPRNERWDEAWRVTERLIEMLSDEVARHDARLVVVTMTNALQVHPDPELRRAARERFGVGDLFYPEHRLTAHLESKGVPVLTLGPIFLQYAVSNNTYIHGRRESRNLGKGHWNETGHRLAGEALAQWICDRHFLRPYTTGPARQQAAAGPLMSRPR